MPFIKKQFNIGDANLHQTYLPRELSQYAHQYAAILQEATEKADGITQQAQYNADQLLTNSEQQSKRLLTQTKTQIAQLKQEAEAEIAHIREQAVNEAVIEAQEMVVNQACDLIQQLHTQTEQFKSENLPFVHQLLKDVVASLLQNLDAKQQVLIMAEKLANKALQIEQGILFLNPVHEHNLPKLMLPPSWKIAFDALLLEDEAKLSAGGSEWRTQFSNLKQALLQWFDEQAPEEVIDSIDETEDITLEQTQSTHPEEENEQAQALDETYDYFSDRHEENNEVLEDNDEDNDDDEDEYDEDGDEDNEDDNDLDKSVFNR